VAVAAGRIGLHRRRHQLELLAEPRERALRRRVGSVGAHEAVSPFERLCGALEALAHQGRGHQPVHRRPADLETLGPGTVDQELEAARALAQHRAHGPGDPVRVQAENARGGGGGPKSAACGRRVEATVVVRAGG
jgi:hypothetical protein